MARTNAALVEGVLGYDYLASDGISLDPYINAATTMMDRVVAKAASQGVPLTSNEALQVETWLSAHLYTQMDNTYVSRRTKDAVGEFRGTVGMNLSSSLYGQTAMMLDPSGCLRGMQNILTIKWLGKTYSERDADPNTGW